MPSALGALIIGLTGASGPVAVLIGGVFGGLAGALNALISTVFGASTPKPSDGQQVIRQSIGSRKRHYGIVHTGGQQSFLESSGGTLGMVVTLGTGEEGDILEHRINNNKVTLDGSGTVTQSSYHGAIHIYTRSGTASQTAISQLTAKFPQWTANHRQRGCAHVALICDPVDQDKFSEVYNGQQPAYTQIRWGARVYDPRLDSTAGGTGAVRLSDSSTWPRSDNAALVIADYFAHPDGYGAGYGNVNWARVAIEADICDQTVTTVTAATIKRWRIWASYSLSTDERRQVLANMLKASDAFCWQDAAGKFNFMVGRYVAPSVVITDDHVVSMTAVLGPKATERVSAVKVLYTEAAIGYREQESATVGSAEVVEDPNTDPQSVELYFAPHHNQAVRVGKLVLARLGNRWHITAELNLYGLNLLGERFCRLELAQLGVSADFMIENLKLDLGKMRVTATLTEIKAADWDFDAATEEGTPPLMPEDTTAIVVIPVPYAVTLSSVQIALGSGQGVAIEASWSTVRAGLTYEARYRPTTGGTWVSMTVDNAARTARSGPVNSGTQYEVQVRALTISYWASAWSASVDITPTATVSLSAPTELAATGGAGVADITFRMPTGATLAFARLYRNSTNDFSTATQVGGDVVGGLGEVMSVHDSGLSAGTEYYWARAFATGGGSSALAGPATATIS
ncbi:MULTISPECIES: fibronectin type III domain-containing protein [unclassified Novosphingobium]|uniref:fibronectin type III domain-containing protein n=1 Tax=unclassified Novosphingobium TaxID=2644732 RepID=UPI000D436D9A|nr:MULTISPECIES: fibronectin type III domain-containing protein [unclassified Novosphingobium]PTR11753.1 hypothetical protein C8K11_104112 [Novosphingobium sp. GV055]PUB04793.1 hypothetical protein C8K12_104112 [Novosphingobium sp. GV061]PUB21112.1 hypothetical protein C8K14_104112 [Novosphingobium sp. GV079]PUB42838.1 hypothetical protein C8K10_104112 [Novosphingobium sp. GV027]